MNQPKFDRKTEEWFAKQPEWMVATCRQCEGCGLFYKSSLGHECEVNK